MAIAGAGVGSEGDNVNVLDVTGSFGASAALMFVSATAPYSLLFSVSSTTCGDVGDVVCCEIGEGGTSIIDTGAASVATAKGTGEGAT